MLNSNSKADYKTKIHIHLLASTVYKIINVPVLKLKPKRVVRKRGMVIIVFKVYKMDTVNEKWVSNNRKVIIKNIWALHMKLRITT